MTINYATATKAFCGGQVILSDQIGQLTSSRYSRRQLLVNFTRK